MCFRKNEGWTLILGGGGAKGAYQMGVWRALREMSIPIKAIVGTSVGALNGAFIAMNKYREALELWRTLTLDRVIALPSGMMKKGKLTIDKTTMPFLKELRNHFFQSGGLDTAPLQNLIQTNIQEEKIRKSGIDFGIVAYRLTNFQPEVLFLDKIPEGKLSDYLLASSTFPGFKSTVIDGKQYIDGGLYDNIPFAIAKERGYRKMIVVDVSGIGMNKKPDISGSQTIYIKNSMDPGGIFDFDPGKAEQFIQLGYLDAMKTFGRLEGIKYFYRDDRRETAKIEKILFSDAAICGYKSYLPPSSHHLPGVDLEKSIRELLPQGLREYRHLSLVLMECAALSLNIERNRLYSLKELLKLVCEKAIGADVHQPQKKKGFVQTMNDIINGNSLLPLQIFSVLAKYYL